jgi:hypothetical protein
VFPVEIGRLLGEGLGLYHTQAVALLENPALQSLVAHPMILMLERGGNAALGQFGRIGPAAQALTPLPSCAACWPSPSPMTKRMQTPWGSSTAASRPQPATSK